MIKARLSPAAKQKRVVAARVAHGQRAGAVIKATSRVAAKATTGRSVSKADSSRVAAKSATRAR